MSVKSKIKEAHTLIYKAKKIVLDLLDMPMSDAEKTKILELYRLLK